VLAWLSVWSAVQTCIWPSWCHCHSLSLASVKSRLVLPFWYPLTRVVPDKGPLNGCVCVGVALRAWLWSVLTEPFHCFSVLEIAVDTGLMCRWLLCYRNWRRIKWHCSEGATFWNAPCRTSAHNTKLWKHNLTRTKLTCRLELSCFSPLPVAQQTIVMSMSVSPALRPWAYL